jgi:16S rRNA (cytosine967-C5)-methyltransferase
MEVLDLFAAPGGKTAYIASLMNDEGKITAVDRFESRLNILEKNMERLGFRSIQIFASDALEFNNGLFDRVLADVPCSGTGTLSKKPDIKWKKSLIDISRMNEYQLKYISKAASLVKPDGYFVYSTCSIEPEENFVIVEKFLEKNPNFQLISAKGFFPDSLVDENGCIQTLPHIHQMDGAFAAKIGRVS